MEDQNLFTELENLLLFLRYEASKLGLRVIFGQNRGKIRGKMTRNASFKITFFPSYFSFFGPRNLIFWPCNDKTKAKNLLGADFWFLTFLDHLWAQIWAKWPILAQKWPKNGPKMSNWNKLKKTGDTKIWNLILVVCSGGDNVQKKTVSPMY